MKSLIPVVCSVCLPRLFPDQPPDSETPPFQRISQPSGQDQENDKETISNTILVLRDKFSYKKQSPLLSRKVEGGNYEFVCN